MKEASVSVEIAGGGSVAGEAMVEIEGLTKVFPVRRTWAQALRHPFAKEEQTAVSNVSLSVRRGEFFGLLGPNGAGKSTLFKMLATLILPDSGRARIGGHDVVSNGSAVRRLVTPVQPDERSLYWRLSARDNLRLFAALHHIDRASAEDAVTRMLEAVGLADTAEKMVGQFSSGMKQRLLIARALLAEPDVLLLDEPTRSLDPLSARAFRAFLREEIAERQGRTVLLATHNAEEALELCDRLAVLHHGRLLAVGTVDQLQRDVGDDTYRALVRVPEGWSPGRLESIEGVHDAELSPSEEDGWHVLDLRVPGDSDDASRVLTSLGSAGLVVARFERIELTLADLLGRIVDREDHERGVANGTALQIEEPANA